MLLTRTKVTKGLLFSHMESESFFSPVSEGHVGAISAEPLMWKSDWGEMRRYWEFGEVRYMPPNDRIYADREEVGFINHKLQDSGGELHTARVRKFISREDMELSQSFCILVVIYIIECWFL